MKTIRIALLYDIGSSHISPMMEHANDAIERNLISELPKITVENGKITKQPTVMVIECTEKDWPFWYALYLGICYSRNNRDIVCGI